MTHCAKRPSSGSPRLCEPAICGNETLQHRHDQPDGIGGGLATLAGQYLGIGDQIAMERARQLHRHFHGFVLNKWSEFQLCHGQLL